MVIYFGLKGKFKNVWQSDEFWAYLIIVGLLAVIVILGVYNNIDLLWEKVFWDSFFQIVFIIIIMGFVLVDYIFWGNVLIMLFFVLFFLGVCVGFMSGGIKLIWYLVFFKNFFFEFKCILYFCVVILLKLNGQVVIGRILIYIIIFLLLYMILFVIGFIVVVVLGLEFIIVVGVIVMALGNVGFGIGGVGLVDNFVWLSLLIKFVFFILMLFGCLELFMILVLFMFYFWKLNQGYVVRYSL